jgi:hypothetical protein
LHTTMTFLRQHLLWRKGRSCSANGLNYIRNSSNKNDQPDPRRLASAFIRCR